METLGARILLIPVKKTRLPAGIRPSCFPIAFAAFHYSSAVHSDCWRWVASVGSPHRLMSGATFRS